MNRNMKLITLLTLWSVLFLFIGMAIGQKLALDSSEMELTNLSIERTKLNIKILNHELLEQ